jgi:8-oxo-dGTP pyrophosphatase MutT (NUDIX family)
MMSEDSGWQPAKFPVSIKGVAVQNGQVLLLKNERREWELPGGKLDSDETPVNCLAREFLEESDWTVAVGDILHAWLYHIKPGVDVFVTVYGCPVLSDKPPQVSHEHKEARLFKPSEVPDLNMPEDYKIAIAKWCSLQGLE